MPLKLLSTSHPPSYPGHFYAHPNTKVTTSVSTRSRTHAPLPSPSRPPSCLGQCSSKCFSLIPCLRLTRGAYEMQIPRVELETSHHFTGSGWEPALSNYPGEFSCSSVGNPSARCCPFNFDTPPAALPTSNPRSPNVRLSLSFTKLEKLSFSTSES